MGETNICTDTPLGAGQILKSKFKNWLLVNKIKYNLFMFDFWGDCLNLVRKLEQKIKLLFRKKL